MNKFRDQLRKTGSLGVDRLLKKQRRRVEQAQGHFSGSEVDQSQYLPLIGKAGPASTTPRMIQDLRNQRLNDTSILEEPASFGGDRETQGTYGTGGQSNPFLANHAATPGG
jgi:hypothetical protein